MKETSASLPGTFERSAWIQVSVRKGSGQPLSSLPIEQLLRQVALRSTTSGRVFMHKHLVDDKDRSASSASAKPGHVFRHTSVAALNVKHQDFPKEQ